MLLKTMLGTILDYYIAWYNQDFWVTRKQPKNGFQAKLEQLLDNEIPLYFRLLDPTLQSSFFLLQRKRNPKENTMV